MWREISDTLFPIIVFLIPLVAYLCLQTLELMAVMNEPTADELKSGEKRFARFRRKNGLPLTRGRAFHLSLRSTLPALLLAAAILSLAYPYWHSLLEETRASDENALLVPVLLWVPLFVFFFLTHLLHLPFMLLVNRIPANACARHFIKSYRYFSLFLFFYCVLGIYLSF